MPYWNYLGALEIKAHDLFPTEALKGDFFKIKISYLRPAQWKKLKVSTFLFCTIAFSKWQTL